MMIQPPPEDRPFSFGRAAVLLVSLGVLIAFLFGYIAQYGGQPRQHIPMDPGVPATVTTIGGPR